jgi:hypothetical protein
VDLPKSSSGLTLKTILSPQYSIEDKKPVLKELKEELKSVDEYILPPTLTGKGRPYAGMSPPKYARQKKNSAPRHLKGCFSMKLLRRQF